MVRLFLLVSVALLISCTPATDPPAADPPAEAPTAAAGGAAPLARPDLVQIEMYEWSLSVEPSELPAGRYRVEVANFGERVHSATIAGPGVDLETRRLRAGGTLSVDVEFAPGEYTLWCPIGDHRDFGMVTYLTVVSAPS
ncbi:MAG: hypothetical protein U0556_01495 [Dehalococcoidia bacterium]